MLLENKRYAKTSDDRQRDKNRLSVSSVNGLGRVGFESGHIILLFFYPDSNSTRLNSGQKI
jgi:hypothetical protein